MLYSKSSLERFMRIFEGKTVYTVSEVNSITRDSLEKLSFWVEGEISSFKGSNPHYRYLYFDLKDPKSGFKLPCILEPDTHEHLDFDLVDGQKILALGNLTLWEKEARLQMYVLKIEEFGEGILLAQLEKLKQNLEKKGYFDKEKKKDLPAFPANIAVISSEVSDAWHDFKKHSVDNFPVIKIALFDVKVQGAVSTRQIISALKLADKRKYDLIVIVRGGGSLEDLQSFNDEHLAEAIFMAKTPIVVGVGHEKDITIASLVADVNASTPTDAAKIVTADFVSFEEKLDVLIQRVQKSFLVNLSAISQLIDLIYHKLITTKERYQSMPRHLNFLRQSLKNSEITLIDNNNSVLLLFYSKLKSHWQFIKEENRRSVQDLLVKLNLLSPSNTLKRGYSISYSQDSQVMRDVGSIDVGSKVRVQLWQGSFQSKVVKKQP